MTKKELDFRTMCARQAYDQATEVERTANKKAEEALQISLAAWDNYQVARADSEQGLLEGSND